MEYIIAILYYFRQGGKLIKNSVTIGGNLDPFYLLAPLYIKDNFKNKKRIKLISIVFITMIVYLFIQEIFIGDINILKGIVNIVKITICFIGMLYAKENYRKADLKKIAKIVSILYAASIPIAYFFKDSSILWRHNDIHNKYTLMRLHLFYLEPSELGFHISIIVILLLGFIFVSKSKKEIGTMLLLIFLNLVVLYLARPLGAIVILTFTIICMIVLDYIYHPSKQKIKLYALAFLVFIVVCIYMIISKSPIYMRILETLNGTDASNNFRIKVSLDVLKESLMNTKFIGAGFGNMNTEAFLARYNYLGLTEVLANSFIYYIIETGIFGIITLITGLFILFKNCMQSKSIIKWGLIIFLITYQILGGHFTSGLYWGLYGIILSGFNEKYDNCI